MFAISLNEPLSNLPPSLVLSIGAAAVAAAAVAASADVAASKAALPVASA